MLGILMDADRGWFAILGSLSALRGELPADSAIPAFDGVYGLQRQCFELVGEFA